MIRKKTRFYIPAVFERLCLYIKCFLSDNCSELSEQGKFGILKLKQQNNNQLIG